MVSKTSKKISILRINSFSFTFGVTECVTYWTLAVLNLYAFKQICQHITMKDSLYLAVITQSASKISLVIRRRAATDKREIVPLGRFFLSLSYSRYHLVFGD